MGLISQMLRTLERNEREAVAAFNPQHISISHENKVLDSEVLKNIFRTSFCIQKDGGLEARLKHWGTCPVGVPIPWALLLQPQLIVDLPPTRENDFQRNYGVSVGQFHELCRLWYVIPNIYEFESQKLQKFSDYDQCGHLASIIDPASRLCRINSIRRNRGFDILVESSNRLDEIRMEGMDAFAPHIKKITEFDLGDLIRCSTYESALVRLSENWLYVNLLGDRNDRLFLERLREGAIAQDVRSCIKYLVQTKVLVSSSYVASFGGTYNASSRQTLGPIYSSDQVTGSFTGSEMRLLSERGTAFAEFLGRIALSSFSQRWNEPGLGVKSALTDREFQNFLAFLNDNNALIRKFDEILNDFSRIVDEGDEDIKLSRWNEYLNIYELLRSQIDTDQAAFNWFGKAAITTTALVAVKWAGENTKLGRRAVLCLGTTGWMLAEAAWDKMLDPIVQEVWQTSANRLHGPHARRIVERIGAIAAPDRSQ